MSRSNFFKEKSFSVSDKIGEFPSNRRLSSRQSLKAKFDRESGFEVAGKSNSCELSTAGGGWCDAFSLPMSNINAKQAWKNGTEKLSQTFNNVRTTFGTLSQRLKKSTKRRQPLINMDSPNTPATPYTRSKAVLGRTPTKLYSPFKIDTPTGKENHYIRTDSKKISIKGSTKTCKKKIDKRKSDPQQKYNCKFSSPERKLSNDLLQTQIGIYEFQSVANKIIQNGSNN